MMSLAVKRALYRQFLITLTQCDKFLSVRYYPRWTHRRPVRIVENDVTEEEKRLWKLGVEREVYFPKASSFVVDSGTCADNNRASKMLIHEEKGGQKLVKKILGNDKFKDTPVSINKGDFLGANDLELKDSKGKCMVNEVNLKSTPEFNRLVAASDFPKSYRQNKSFKSDKNEIKLKNAATKLGVPVFSDLGRDDKILSKYMTDVKSRKRRQKIGKMLLEGKRLIKDAVDAGIIPEAVFFSQISDLKYLDLPPAGIKIYKLTYKEMCLWSDVTTPQGVIAFVNIPDVSPIKPSSLPLTVVCDNVHDPGNMGTILRTCVGIGCQQVILTKGCVDLWEPKVLRAGAGAHFRMSIRKDLHWSDVVKQIPTNCCAFVAENNTFSPRDTKGPRSFDSDKTEEPMIALEEQSDRNGMHSSIAPAFGENLGLSLPPVIPYYSFNYPSVSSLVLIVGGETKGVSLNAYELVLKTGGARLNIPLSNEMESLNVNTALGVIGFEIKKQLFLDSCKDLKTERISRNM